MQIILVITAILYVLSLAIVDGFFNRLIFREKRKYSYFSKEKQQIYKMREWKIIGVFFLIIIPIIIPVIIAFVFGGIKYVLVYLLIFLIFDWDLIFGKIVFDNWFGDTPSIALPFAGWKHFNLKKTIIIRVALAISVLILFLKI